ncbi:MAG TPA: prolyl oligopeptidase family serine peptidase, partial [Verrucomicrobiota bacterium]|nr:prolyl oligopeptidase family serine peptidase [Verrucomicrobiota bacterium]
KCDLTSYECTDIASSGSQSAMEPVEPAVEFASMAAEDPASFVDEEHEVFLSPQAEGEGARRGALGRGQRRGGVGRGFSQASRTSPDGKWSAFVRDYNVFVRSVGDGREVQLSHDGVTNNYYGRLEWMPDSQTLVAWRIEPGDNEMVYLIRSSPRRENAPNGGYRGRAELTERPYPLPGDKFTAYELNLFNVATGTQIKPEVERVDFGSPNIRINRDGIHFTYEKVDRGHGRFRVIEIDSRTGAARNIIDEKSDTFIWTAHTEEMTQRGLRLTTYLDDTDEIIYSSEQDGWRHLYLIDAKAGKVKNQITKGEWVVRGIDEIDRENRQIWFNAGGMNPDQDPYFIHYYRINFDGSGLVALTEGNGTHTIQYSPDRKYIIDSYSRPDAPPKHELRRVSDGRLMCELEEADISELLETGWRPPEVFVAKGRDGKTDIWGNIYRPPHLDPDRKYPILEDIYAGPQSSFTPKSFSAGNRYQQYNDAGFIVVKLDGMGTANRSKAFHDVCYKNLKDGGFPDRILWIKAAAAKYPYMDLDRVGLFGGSAGGQNVGSALLFHGDFYKVGVANCGCHDNRMDKASWNEQWMGYMPKEKIWNNDPDNWYSQSSNIDNAYRLRGKLFLIVGEMDSNVPPESTLRFVDALIQARKDFDMLVIPNAGHGASSPITQRRTLDFFRRHLQGIEPPDRNAAEVEAPAGS